MAEKAKYILVKIGKATAWFAGFLLLLILIAIVLIRIPSIQNAIVDKVERQLKGQLNTELSVGHVFLNFPTTLEIASIYLEDQQMDTLLFVNRVEVKTDLWELLNKNIEINDLNMSGVKTKIYRDAKHIFNYEFLLKSGDHSDTATATSEPWKFDIEDIRIDSLEFSFDDSLQSTSIRTRWRSLFVSVDELDLDEPKLFIEEIKLSGAVAKYSQGEIKDISSSNSEEQTATPFNFIIEKVAIEGSRIYFDNSQQELDASLGLLAVEVNKLDLLNLEIQLEQLTLEHSTLKYLKRPIDTPSKADSADSSNDWKVSLAQLNLSDNSLRVDLDTLKSDPSTFNPRDFAITKLQGGIRDVYYSESRTAASLERLEFLTDDLSMRLQGHLSMNEKQLNLQDFTLSSQMSSIDAGLNLAYDNLDELISTKTELDLQLNSCDLYKSDLAYFVPVLKDFQIPDAMSLEGQLKGKMEDIQLEGLQAKTGRSSLFIQGSVQNPHTPELLSYSIESLSLLVDPGLVKLYMPDSLNIQLSDNLRVSGQGSGSTQNFKGELGLFSSYGDVTFNIEEMLFRRDHIAFLISSKTLGFDVGKLVGQDGLLNGLKFDLRASGSGEDVESIAASIDARVQNLVYNSYSYDSLQLNLEYNESVIEGKVDIQDPNLGLTFSGNFDISPQAYKNNLAIILKEANLEALNFSRTPLKIAGSLTSNFQTADFRHFNGNVALRHFSAENDIDRYQVDSLVIASIDQVGKTEITINSDIALGKFRGNVDLFSVAETLKEHIDQYYDLSGVAQDDSPEVNFDFEFDLLNSDLVTEIIFPPLEDFKPGQFSAQFNSVENKLDMVLGIDHFKYNGFVFDSLKLRATSNNRALNSNLSLRKLASTNTAIENLNLSNIFSDNLLSTTFRITDSLNVTQYLIRAASASVDSTYEVTVSADSLILDYDPWRVDQKQPLVFGKSDKIREVGLELTRDNQKLSFKTDISDSALHVGFDNILLSTLGRMLTKDENVAQGILNGQLDFLVYAKDFDILGDLKIADLTILNRFWGTLNLRIDQADREKNVIFASLKSSENDLTITSEYDLNDLEDVQVLADIKVLQLNTIEPLLSQHLDTLNGLLSGEIRLVNSVDVPNLNGHIRLKGSTFKPALLKTTFFVHDGGISFDNSVIKLADFQLKDGRDNLATLNGTVELVSTTFANLDLQVSTSDFLVLNTTKEDNEFYYGKLGIDGYASISGSTSRPNIRSKIKLSKNSNLTYVIPQTDYNALNTSNVVQFVNYEEEQIQSPLDSLKAKVEFEGLNLNAQLEIDKSAVFTMIVDPITQDQLTVKGNATLNATVNRIGDVRLNGRYTIDEGAYNFSFYNLLKRKFIIEEGSSIVWTGDPYSATLNLSAYNRVEAAPIDLLANQMTNVSAAELNQYRQRLPFLVYINIDGELMEPQIGFKLDMPSESRNAFGGLVYVRVLDLNSRESDLNKQVFSLLLLQRFISDDPLNSEGGYDLEDRARRSVSRILSDQLNRLADNVNGVNLSLDLQSYQDYSNGSSQGTTQLELGVSKNLFNERLEVKVAGNVNLEGSEQQSLSDYVGDLALEYKITDDGRLRIIGFRRSDFDVLSGEVVETGAGLIYVRDYNTFKELFRRVDDK